MFAMTLQGYQLRYPGNFTIHSNLYDFITHWKGNKIYPNPFYIPTSRETALLIGFPNGFFLLPAYINCAIKTINWE